MDPTGPAGGNARCIRGGSWRTEPLDCRSAVRDAMGPTGHDMEVGFRVAVR